MSLRYGRLTTIAGLILTLSILIAATASPGQTGKPAYDPEVEAVARTIFFEILSPY